MSPLACKCKHYAGTQRIAIPQGDDVRKDGALYYLLGDHLGSTSLVTDSAGTGELEDNQNGEVAHLMI